MHVEGDIIYETRDVPLYDFLSIEGTDALVNGKAIEAAVPHDIWGLVAAEKENGC